MVGPRQQQLGGHPLPALFSNSRLTGYAVNTLADAVPLGANSYRALR